MTAVSPGRVSTSSTLPFPWIVVVFWLAAVALGNVPASAQTTGDPAMSVEWTVAPAALGPGERFVLDGTVTIDPGNGTRAGGEGTRAWFLVVRPVDAVTIDGAACQETTGTSCVAAIGAGEETIRFSGVVEDDPPGAVTAGIEMTGTIDGQLERDTFLVAAETCGTVRVEPGAGTPAPGRLPARAATPDATCAGDEGTIEITVVPATQAPTEPSTEEPTEVPAEEPTVVFTEAATPAGEPTATPTEGATAAPPATPTEIPTAAPTPTPTIAPTATAEPTAAPTTTPTATVEPTATVKPTATIEPTESLTEEAAATMAPTEMPTQEPTVTASPTDTPVVEPATGGPQPTPDDGDGDDDTGLWIGVGSLVVLGIAAGAVLYQRRKLSA